MIILRGDIIELLKKRGYSTYKLKKENILSGSVITRISKGENIDFKTLNILCTLIGCHPADLLVYIPDDETEKLHI